MLACDTFLAVHSHMSADYHLGFHPRQWPPAILPMWAVLDSARLEVEWTIVLMQAAKRYRQFMRKAALYTAGGTLTGLAIFGFYR